MQQQALRQVEYWVERTPAYEACRSYDSQNVLAMVLAGGRGERLYPLTGHRAKPAVPFGGSYRLIDFVLSNMVNSAIPEIHVLTQYRDHSLEDSMRLSITSMVLLLSLLSLSPKTSYFFGLTL